MARAKNQDSKVVNLPIEGEMTIFLAQELRDAILPVIDQYDEIELDLSRVTEIDAAGLQLLVAAKLESILKGKTLRCVGHTQNVQDMLDLCDLCGFFGDQVVLPSKS